MLKSRKFYALLFFLGALYVLIVQQFFHNEGKYLIQSQAYSEEYSYKFQNDFQELNLNINQNVSLHGLWFKKKDSRGIALLFPDSKMDLREIDIDNNLYYKNGFDVLYIAYRGSGKSRGDLSSETDLFSDAQHWYSFSKAQFEEENILIVGQGFGGSIAAQLAASTNSNILILEHPYFSYGEYQAQSRFWWLPYNYFTSFQLKTWKEIRKTRCSIILMDEKQNVKENRLVSYLKKSDLSYWVNSENSLPYSSQPENDGLFKKILTPLTQH